MLVYRNERGPYEKSTRNDLINAAGQIIAEVGYASITNQAVAKRAGSSAPAIGYYFGGKPGLYKTVLAEAHQRFISMNELEAISRSDMSAEEKLKVALRLIVRTARCSSEFWWAAVLFREMLSFSHVSQQPLLESALPKLALLRTLVRDVMGVPSDSLEARYAVAFLTLPHLALLLFPSELKHSILPEQDADLERFEETFCAYVLGGLRGMREAFSY